MMPFTCNQDKWIASMFMALWIIKRLKFKNVEVDEAIDYLFY